MRHKPVGRPLGFYLLCRFAKGQRFGLRENICEKDVMMTTYRRQRLAERDEIARNQSRALMDQLIKGVLSVGSRFTPEDGTRVVGDGFSIECHILAVALHGQLLEVGGEALEILFVREHRDGLRFEEVGVPNNQQRHEHWEILLKG